MIDFQVVSLCSKLFKQMPLASPYMAISLNYDYSFPKITKPVFFKVQSNPMEQYRHKCCRSFKSRTINRQAKVLHRHEVKELYKQAKML